jgi:linoleoyl-CoA desaturase
MNTAVEKHVPRYRHKDVNQFYSTLRERVNAYFRDNHLARKGGIEIAVKTTLLFTIYVASYIAMNSNQFSLWGTFAWALVFGLANVLLVFNVAHDATHNALFANPLLNRIFRYTFNLVGGNAYLWHITHNELHHAFPNVGDVDSDIHQQTPLIRISPTTEKKWYHRYQAYYATALYMIFSLFLVFQKDYEDIGIIYKKDSPLLGRKHSKRAMISFFGWKLVYYTITVVIPFILIDVSWWQFLVGFVLVHMAMSILLVSVLVPVHLVDEAGFALPENGVIEDSWALHVMKNTMDFSAESKLANYLFGGLNNHLAHHLFPQVTHVHHVAISRIIKQTAEDLGLTYTNVSMMQALASHYRLLKRMSQ